MWCDGNCLSVQFIGNRVVNNTYAGIYYETGYGPALIANNTMIGNCTALAGLSVWHCAEIWLNDSQNVEIRNNTGTATTNAIAGTDQDRGSTAFGVRMICRVTVHDNTIALGPNGANGLATNWTNPCPTTPWVSW